MIDDQHRRINLVICLCLEGDERFSVIFVSSIGFGESEIITHTHCHSFFLPVHHTHTHCMIYQSGKLEEA